MSDEQERMVAGWYPAPDSPGHNRYWNGSHWTRHYAPRGGDALAAYTPGAVSPATSTAATSDAGSPGTPTGAQTATTGAVPGGPAAPPTPGRQRIPAWAMALCAVVALALAVVVIVVLAARDNGDGQAGETEVRAATTDKEQTTASDPPSTSEERETTTTPSTTTTTSPGPIPQSVIVSGRGDDVIEVTKPDSGETIVVARHSGQASFIVQSDAEGLIDAIGPYEGAVLMDGPRNPGGNTTSLEVTADGTWIIEFRSARSARAFDAEASGRGSDVVRYTGPTSQMTWHHFGAAQFTVYADDALVIRETGEYQGAVRTPSGALLAITADGEWSAFVGP